jgi:hypothetical protein
MVKTAILNRIFRDVILLRFLMLRSTAGPMLHAGSHGAEKKGAAEVRPCP